MRRGLILCAALVACSRAEPSLVPAPDAEVEPPRGGDRGFILPPFYPDKGLGFRYLPSPGDDDHAPPVAPPSGSLPTDAVEAVIRSHSGVAKRACWDRMSPHPSAWASSTIAFVIEPDGGVENATAEGNDPAVNRCLEKVIRGWRFPQAGGETTLNLPFKFFDR